MIENRLTASSYDVENIASCDIYVKTGQVQWMGTVIPSVNMMLDVVI